MSTPQDAPRGSTIGRFAAAIASALRSVGRILAKTESRKASAFVAKADAAQRIPPVPVVDPDPDLLEHHAIQKHIADLMIRDEWVEIADQIAQWEADLITTASGVRYHDIAVETALSGLQHILDSGPRNSLSDLKEAEIEVSHFVASHKAAPDHPILALLAARAHITTGQSCRADFWPANQQQAAWRKMAHHYVAAGEILDKFDAIEHMSPLLGEAHYLQALGSPNGLSRLRCIFADWIDLDPANPTTYATHVPHLLPDRMGTKEEILQEAEAALNRTEQTLGFGGYALFYLPLIAEEPAVRQLIDTELFATAMLDLASNSATQAEVNWVAGALLSEIDATTDEAAKDLLTDTFAMIALQFLTDIYPRFWPVSAEEAQERIGELAAAAPDLVGLGDDAFPAYANAA